MMNCAVYTAEHTWGSQWLNIMSAEETAFHEGKLARLVDERDLASGVRSVCPYRATERVRAWNEGYFKQMAASSPKPEDAEAEARRLEFVAALEGWIARNR